MFAKPILFIVFNRLDTTKLVFQRIKAVKPKEFFIYSDGPRLGYIDEQFTVNEVRDYIVSNIDWPCQIHTNFNIINNGCGKAVSNSLKWFFSNVDEGIILEDDCLPSESFFDFCEQGLDKFREEKRVFMLSGYNPFGANMAGNDTFFSENPAVWGWATWANRLENYDYDLTSWPDSNFDKYLINRFPSQISKYFIDAFNLIKSKKIDTWDYQLVYLVLSNFGLVLKPKSNLIMNIGISGAHSSVKDINHYVPYGTTETSKGFNFPSLIIPEMTYDNLAWSRYKKSSRWAIFKNYIFRLIIKKK